MTGPSTPATTASAAPAPRRSGRERKKAESIYDEAEKEVELLRSASPKKRTPRPQGGGSATTGGGASSGERKAEDDGDNDDDDENKDDGGESPSEDERSAAASSSDESGDESDDDDDFGGGKAASEGAAAKRKGAGKRAKKTQIRTGRSPVPPSTGRRAPRGGRGGAGARVGGSGAAAATAARRAAHQSLAALARHVLPPGETPGLSSLAAGLLHSYRPAGEDVDLGDVPPTSEYTPNLVALARKVVAVHNDDPNKAQVALLNLLFRSVGGSEATDMSLGASGNGNGQARRRAGGLSDSDEEEEDEGEEETILDEMDTDDWARVVTDLVDDLRHVPAARIPLCADPLGAVHQAHELAERERRMKEEGKSASHWVLDGEESQKQASAGAVEYRKIYAEFWRALGHVALTDGGMATAGAVGEFESQGSQSNSEEVADPTHVVPVVVRRDAELVKAVLLRVVELSPVGQPDVRAAATLAALSVAHSVLDQSAALVKKMDVAGRQYAAAAKGGGEEGAKAEALKARTESLRRTVEDLEEVVLVPVVQGLFVHRYRDSNEHVRAMCLDSLSRFTLQRPDIFLTDKYLKYFGWMTHDKNPRVRLAAFRGLLRPFDAVSDAAAGKERPAGDECLMVDKIDLGALENVVAKFLPRIADAVMDPAGEVQEAAMKLMLALLKGGFLDEISEDKLWDQTNQRCLAEDAPSVVQKDALYFILDQLEAFDEGGENEKVAPDERKRAQQLDAIASYAAHTLTNGPVPIDKIQVKVSDLLVKSLREMPEHRGLVTDWSAMLRAIKEDNAASTAHLVTAGDRANVAKQRVLVRMLACAARLEVGSVADAAFLHRGTDVDALEMTSANSRPSGKGKKAHMGREHENLSVALLEALPNLLIQFKGDTAIIPELASLPRFLIPTVYSLPQRKEDYNNLVRALAEIYLSSSNDCILTSTACSLVSLCDGDHARVPESKAQLRKVVVELRDRIVELMSSDDSTIATSAVSVDPASSDFTSVRSKRRSSAKKKTPASSVRGPNSPASDKTSLTGDRSDVPDADSEYSIFLNLKRLKILSKKCDLSVFFDDRNDVNQLELLCNFVTDGLKSRLRACKPVDMRTINPDEETTVHKVIDSPEVLAAIGKSVGEGLEFLLCVIAWFLHSVQEKEDLVVEEDDLIDNSMEEDEDDNIVQDHVVIRLRSRLLSTLELCFAQYLLNSDDRGDDETSVAQHSEAQHSFADFVQLAAGKVVSDIRTLFPKEYADAASPILRSFAAYQDGRLIGAAVRFLESKEQLLHENDGAASSAESKLSQALLYPMGRALATNWTNGNRREAGMFLRHIDGSGPTAAAIVSETSRQMKKIDPVRMLESQMASLRQSYENWVDDTPELESDFPSEDEMAEFEYTEKVHKEQFDKLEQRASQFSSALGVFGKLSNKKLGPALKGFVREGIRFSFSNLDSSGEDSLVLGSRLSFLLLLSKYANWAKKDRKHKAEIQDHVDGRETEMRDHEEFEEVHVDDLDALATFRSIVGLKPLPAPKSGASVMSSGVSVASASARSARSATRSVASAGASVMSGRSSRSVMSSRSVASASARSSKSATRSVASAGASVMSGRSSRSVMSSRSVASTSPRSARSATRSVASAGASVMSRRSSRSVMSGASRASAVSARSTVSARSGVSVASARSGGVSVASASVASSLSDNDNDMDEDESLDGVSSLVSPAPSTGGRSASSRASRTSRLSSALPTLPESSAEKEESPQDEGSESDTHFSESPGDSAGKKRSQSQMTYEHSSDDDSGGHSTSTGSEASRTKRRKT